MNKLPKVKPWLIRKVQEAPEVGEYQQTPEELANYKQYSMCINCMLCYAACPVYQNNEDFLGPASSPWPSGTTTTHVTTDATNGTR